MLLTYYQKIKHQEAFPNHDILTAGGYSNEKALLSVAERFKRIHGDSIELPRLKSEEIRSLSPQSPAFGAFYFNQKGGNPSPSQTQTTHPASSLPIRLPPTGIHRASEILLNAAPQIPPLKPPVYSLQETKNLNSGHSTVFPKPSTPR